MFRQLSLRLVLAAIWMVLSDVFSWPSFVMGLLMATLVIDVLAVPVVKIPRVQWGGLIGFLRWIPKVLHLTVYFAWELLLANIQVTKLVWRGRLSLQPGIIQMDVQGRNASQITLLSMLITLTPGTLVIGTSPDQKLIYIHAIDASDIDETLRVPIRFDAMVAGVLP